MKKLLVLLLALFLLLPAASAADAENPYDSSAWAREYVGKAIALKLMGDHPGYSDLREPILRGTFAGNASTLVAIEFGSNIDGYLMITNYRGQADGDVSFIVGLSYIAQKLGILQGREDGSLDEFSCITRQEAAVMLARTYRAYQDTVPNNLQPLTFSDQGDIADWALEDVQLMNQLGIMNGITEDRFDPLGTYTIEQSLVTLVRLHEKAPYDGSKQENPFVIPPWEGGFWKIFQGSYLLFAMETKDYYICAWTSPNINIGYGPYIYISVIDQDLTRRTYPTLILTRAIDSRGNGHARPENPSISEDGTKLFYTATLEEDAYHFDREDNKTLLYPKGIYTITMDLKTGEQTYTRADLSES